MYTAPINEMQFLLNEVLLKDNEISEIIPTLLEAANKLAREELEPINNNGDEHGTSINQDGNVKAPLGFKEAYQKYIDGYWGSLQFDSKYGGQELPFVVAISTQEMWHAANMSWGLCPLLTQGAIEAIEYGANEELKSAYLPNLISGKWAGTMNLTEPDAGSDLGALKTKALPKNDHYLIKGQKIFVTWGEHDMTENIVHLVLARLPNAPEGVKGISLFLVPKILIDSDGNLTEKNDCRAISVEKKIGIHGSPTCVISYGEKSGAIGYLIGKENKGLECMFEMMNNARLAVGLQGVSIADYSYQKALSYCNDRVQGIAPGYNETGPIIRHPDVKRMIRLMQVLTDGARSLTYYACAELD
ncbi:MAG: acyl-CoA dehydrogenase family protein, partial [Gammaproteobacteria bacterium]|nr:acyl-CoA dehydrogenase family protein [Gammaproteobacteria bacterium]